ncbi:MAG: hypothetical protein E7225_01010 [Clostridiales bacterium]|nr:hypothetical protein [Clostridiales bacterium]
MKKKNVGIVIGITAIIVCIVILNDIAYERAKGNFNSHTIEELSIPQYSDNPYCVINNNNPFFSSDDFNLKSFEEYSKLDYLGRCGPAYANLNRDLLPDSVRESISSVTPTGWHTVRYDDLIADKYLYNRCHLIAYSLTGENDNNKNIITGTRYMNVEGMLPFETMITDYLEENDHHVLYRVTPHFKDQELIARGVLLEAYSVEDFGDGICFCVYVYNVQPGIVIEYSTGESRAL